MDTGVSRRKTKDSRQPRTMPPFRMTSNTPLGGSEGFSVLFQIGWKSHLTFRQACIHCWLIGSLLRTKVTRDFGAFLMISTFPDSWQVDTHSINHSICGQKHDYRITF